MRKREQLRGKNLQISRLRPASHGLGTALSRPAVPPVDCAHQGGVRVDFPEFHFASEEAGRTRVVTPATRRALPVQEVRGWVDGMIRWAPNTEVTFERHIRPRKGLPARLEGESSRHAWARCRRRRWVSNGKVSRSIGGNVLYYSEQPGERRSLTPIEYSSFQHPVNSPQFSATVSLASPRKTGCSLFAAVNQRV